MKREIDLTPYIPAIMSEAEKASEEHFLVLSLLGEGGFRRGEAVGNRDRREAWRLDQFEKARRKAEIPFRKRILDAFQKGYGIVETKEGDYYLKDRPSGKWVIKMRKEDPLPGAQVQDLHDGSLWIKGKGGTEIQQPLPRWLYERLQNYIGNRQSGRIFQVSDDTIYKMGRHYAKLAGVKDWKLVHPHRFRHYYIRAIYLKKRDRVLAQQLARHKDPKMTDHYIGELDMAEKSAAVQSVFEKGDFQE